MKVQLYTDISEKDFNFNVNVKIETLKQFEDFINNFSDRKTFYGFRGQPEAKFKLYNTAQREWLNKNLFRYYAYEHGVYETQKGFRNFITNLIENVKAWNNGLISKYFKHLNLQNNVIAYLSFMQHYGVPTPLLDFTTNIYYAIYFAIEHSEIYPTISEIDKYFSVYYIELENYILDFPNNFLKNELNKEKSIINDFEILDLFPMIIIDDKIKEFNTLNNFNIINQKGFFIFNLSDFNPLEAEVRSAIKMAKMANNKSYEEWSKKIKNEDLFIGCYNISKKLIKDIRSHLQKELINENTIYPNLDKLGRDCLNNEWNKIFNA